MLEKGGGAGGAAKGLAPAHFFPLEGTGAREYIDYTRAISGWQRKHAFPQEFFYLQGIFNYINERDTSFLDCKHKQM